MKLLNSRKTIVGKQLNEVLKLSWKINRKQITSYRKPFIRDDYKARSESEIMCETMAVSAINLTSSNYDLPVQRCISPCWDRYPSSVDHGRATMSTIAFLFCDDSSSK